MGVLFIRLINRGRDTTCTDFAQHARTLGLTTAALQIVKKRFELEMNVIRFFFICIVYL